MITFLVSYGFSVRYVLSRPIGTLTALHSSALRATYTEKLEAAFVMTASIGEALGGGGKKNKHKSPLKLLAEAWKPFMANGEEEVKELEQKNSASAFLSDFQSGKIK